MTSEGLKQNPRKVISTQEMSALNNIKELRTFLGLVQYLGNKFLPHLAKESAPLRQLLEKQVTCHWDEPQQAIHNKLKQMITITTVLGYYNEPKQAGTICR